MTKDAYDQAIENIYTALQNDNQDIDTHIETLKSAAMAHGQKTITFDPARLAQSNRQGRKTMEAYFRKRGLTIGFSS